MKLPKKRRRVVAVQQPRRNPGARRHRNDSADIFPRRINAVKHHNNNNSGAAGQHAFAGHKFVTNGSLHADVEEGRAAGAVPPARKTSRASLLSGILRQAGHREGEGEGRREAAPCYQQNTPNVHLHSQGT